MHHNTALHYIVLHPPLQPVAAITGYDNLAPNSQEAVMEHIATVGPLAISVAANTFKDYNGGVFQGCPYDENIQLNHAVQVHRTALHCTVMPYAALHCTIW